MISHSSLVISCVATLTVMASSTACGSGELETIRATGGAGGAALAAGGTAAESSGGGHIDSGGGISSGGIVGDGDGDGDQESTGGATNGDGDGDVGPTGGGPSSGGAGGQVGEGAGGEGSGGSAHTGGSPGGTGGTVSRTGTCFDEQCSGACVPVEDDDTCDAEWECALAFACVGEVTEFCGCDGETFLSSSSCPDYAYVHEGPCEGKPAVRKCDHSEVVTDDLPPECKPGEIPSVFNHTWGPCVPLDSCGCDIPGSQDQCGDGLSYVCHSSMRCGDLLN